MPTWAVALALWLVVMVPLGIFVAKLIKAGRGPGT
jgi:hypothetical protein